MLNAVAHSTLIPHPPSHARNNGAMATGMVEHKHHGRLVTYVERKPRLLLAGKSRDGTATSFNQVSLNLLNLFKAIPVRYLKTMTPDNGSENTKFKERTSTQAPRSLVCFATPYASWERGTNENTNGFIRRYFPKRTNFLTVSESEFAKVVYLLNHRPSKMYQLQNTFRGL